MQVRHACAVRPPPAAEIYAPEFPSRMDWLNVPFLRMNTLMGRGAVLVEFWDFARIYSLRTLPPDRVAPPLRRPGPARDRRPLARLLSSAATPSWSRAPSSGLRSRTAVLLDPELEVWRLHGNRGWPGRYLSTAGASFTSSDGEGEYLDTEVAIGECLGIDVEPMEPLPAGRRAGRAARTPDGGHRPAGRPGPSGPGA